MYTFDFKTMMQIIQVHRKTVQLTANVQSGVAGIQGPFNVTINVMAGKMVSCELRGSDNRCLKGNEAEQALALMGPIPWTLTQEGDVALTSNLEQQTAGPCPRRMGEVESAQWQSWPRLHQRVFALVDGAKSAEQIARMLSTDQHRVEQALRDLQLARIISYQK